MDGSATLGAVPGSSSTCRKPQDTAFRRELPLHDIFHKAMIHTAVAMGRAILPLRFGLARGTELARAGRLAYLPVVGGAASQVLHRSDDWSNHLIGKHQSGRRQN